ncbi:HepT-like ribonuclease domain-containing protein [Polaromonas sp.]|uniref:HepT-like ribonuclease domain-containing protein n=1 Tax=Polaromonas sp. TaxID=1869339 RepID=UPI003265434E
MLDRKTQDAMIRNLEVIGEACNNISKNHPDFVSLRASVPWGFAYEMRNALSHGYFKVDHAVVWQTLQHDLPDLQKQIAALS